MEVDLGKLQGLLQAAIAHADPELPAEEVGPLGSGDSHAGFNLKMNRKSFRSMTVGKTPEGKRVVQSVAVNKLTCTIVESPEERPELSKVKPAVYRVLKEHTGMILRSQQKKLQDQKERFLKNLNIVQAVRKQFQEDSAQSQNNRGRLIKELENRVKFLTDLAERNDKVANSVQEVIDNVQKKINEMEKSPIAKRYSALTEVLHVNVEVKFKELQDTAEQASEETRRDLLKCFGIFETVKKL